MLSATKPAEPQRWAAVKAPDVRAASHRDAEFMGGRFFALAVATLDDVDADELAAAPLKFIDNRHDRFDRAPADTRLL